MAYLFDKSIAYQLQFLRCYINRQIKGSASCFPSFTDKLSQDTLTLLHFTYDISETEKQTGWENLTKDRVLGDHKMCLRMNITHDEQVSTCLKNNLT